MDAFGVVKKMKSKTALNAFISPVSFIFMCSDLLLYHNLKDNKIYERILISSIISTHKNLTMSLF